MGKEFTETHFKKSILKIVFIDMIENLFRGNADFNVFKNRSEFGDSLTSLLNAISSLNKILSLINFSGETFISLLNKHFENLNYYKEINKFFQI
jgi:hypothetical protein